MTTSSPRRLAYLEGSAIPARPVRRGRGLRARHRHDTAFALAEHGLAFAAVVTTDPRARRAPSALRHAGTLGTRARARGLAAFDEGGRQRGGALRFSGHPEPDDRPRGLIGNVLFHFNLAVGVRG
jgi:hypothetical protein